MAKTFKPDAQGASRPDWSRSHGTYIAGQAYIDEMDLVARDMEAHWGVDRLRLLVAPDMRERFDRQRYLVNQAIWEGDLPTVQRETRRMINAWRACDKAARDAGHGPLSPAVWEASLPDGTVLAVCRRVEDASAYVAQGRKAQVWTLDEVVQMVASGLWMQAVKREFPGARVVGVRSHVADPLDRLRDSKEPLDDPIPFG